MDTKGWDVIYLASVTKCNEAFTKNMAGVITSFDYKSDAIEISGEFGDWQIVNGGSDKFVHFQIPIRSGTLNVNGQITDLAGVTPIISIRLAFVSDPQDTEKRNLTFDASGDDKGGTQNVSCIEVDARGDKATITSQKDPVAWGVLHSHFPQLFSANQAKLSHVFASINLVAPQAASWIAPKEMDFAYLDANEGFFVIFTCLTAKDTSKLPRVPDTSTMDAADDFYICVSEKIFLERMIMPGLPASFGHGATAANFVYKATSDVAGQMEIGEIVNHGDLSTDRAQWAADHYYPKITSLTMTIDNDKLHVVSDGKFDITGLAGASCSFSVNQHNAFEFDAKTQSFSFLADPKPGTNYHKHIPWYDWVFVAPFLAGLVALILELVTNAVTSSVTKSISNSENTRISSNLNQMVAWSGYNNLEITSGSLNQALTLKSSQ